MKIAQHDGVRRSFSRIGADVRIWSPPWQSTGIAVNVDRSGRGERFEIRYSNDTEFFVANVQPKIRHLLLMIRQHEGKTATNAKILCGHDERHLFAATIPDDAGATVLTAMTALKPKEIQRFESYQGVKPQNLHSRRRRLRNGEKIYRQGEYMFVPRPDFVPPQPLGITRDEVLTRNFTRPWHRPNGNQHIAREAYREPGARVHVSYQYPEGLTDEERNALLESDPAARSMPWWSGVRLPDLYVRGTIRHPDHATIDLGRLWYRVYVNTEGESRARRYLAYYD